MCSNTISYEGYVETPYMGHHCCNSLVNLWNRDKFMATDIHECFDLGDTSISSDKTIKRKKNEN